MDNNAIKKLIEENLGLSEYPEKVRDEIISELGKVILMRASLAIMGKMAPEARSQFEGLAQKGDYPGAYEVAEAHIPDFANFVRKEIVAEIEEFKKENNI